MASIYNTIRDIARGVGNWVRENPVAASGAATTAAVSYLAATNNLALETCEPGLIWGETCEPTALGDLVAAAAERPYIATALTGLAAMASAFAHRFFRTAHNEVNGAAPILPRQTNMAEPLKQYTASTIREAFDHIFSGQAAPNREIMIAENDNPEFNEVIRKLIRLEVLSHFGLLSGAEKNAAERRLTTYINSLGGNEEWVRFVREQLGLDEINAVEIMNAVGKEYKKAFLKHYLSSHMRNPLAFSFHSDRIVFRSPPDNLKAALDRLNVASAASERGLSAEIDDVYKCVKGLCEKELSVQRFFNEKFYHLENGNPVKWGLQIQPVSLGLYDIRTLNGMATGFVCYSVLNLLRSAETCLPEASEKIWKNVILSNEWCLGILLNNNSFTFHHFPDPLTQRDPVSQFIPLDLFEQIHRISKCSQEKRDIFSRSLNTIFDQDEDAQPIFTLEQGKKPNSDLFQQSDAARGMTDAAFETKYGMSKQFVFQIVQNDDYQSQIVLPSALSLTTGRAAVMALLETLFAEEELDMFAENGDRKIFLKDSRPLDREHLCNIKIAPADHVSFLCESLQALCFIKDRVDVGDLLDEPLEGQSLEAYTLAFRQKYRAFLGRYKTWVEADLRALFQKHRVNITDAQLESLRRARTRKEIEIARGEVVRSVLSASFMLGDGVWKCKASYVERQEVLDTLYFPRQEVLDALYPGSDRAAPPLPYGEQFARSYRAFETSLFYRQNQNNREFANSYAAFKAQIQQEIRNAAPGSQSLDVPLARWERFIYLIKNQPGNFGRLEALQREALDFFKAREISWNGRGGIAARIDELVGLVDCPLRCLSYTEQFERSYQVFEASSFYQQNRGDSEFLRSYEDLKAQVAENIGGVNQGNPQINDAIAAWEKFIYLLAFHELGRSPKVKKDVLDFFKGKAGKPRDQRITPDDRRNEWAGCSYGIASRMQELVTIVERNAGEDVLADNKRKMSDAIWSFIKNTFYQGEIVQKDADFHQKINQWLGISPRPDSLPQSPYAEVQTVLTMTKKLLETEISPYDVFQLHYGSLLGIFETIQSDPSKSIERLLEERYPEMTSPQEGEEEALLRQQHYVDPLTGSLDGHQLFDRFPSILIDFLLKDGLLRVSPRGSVQNLVQGVDDLFNTVDEKLGRSLGERKKIELERSLRQRNEIVLEIERGFSDIAPRVLPKYPDPKDVAVSKQVYKLRPYGSFSDVSLRDTSKPPAEPRPQPGEGNRGLIQRHARNSPDGVNPYTLSLPNPQDTQEQAQRKLEENAAQGDWARAFNAQLKTQRANLPLTPLSSHGDSLSQLRIEALARRAHASTLAYRLDDWIAPYRTGTEEYRIWENAYATMLKRSIEGIPPLGVDQGGALTGAARRAIESHARNSSTNPYFNHPNDAQAEKEAYQIWQGTYAEEQQRLALQATVRAAQQVPNNTTSRPPLIPSSWQAVMYGQESGAEMEARIRTATRQIQDHARASADGVNPYFLQGLEMESWRVWHEAYRAAQLTRRRGA